MARQVAARWLSENSRQEFRFTAMAGMGKSEADVRLMVGSLRRFRDGKAEIALADPVLDLGVREIVGTNSVEVWSSNLEGLRKVARWIETRGFETDFIW